MQAYIAEFVGTLILVLLGDGVVAAVLLRESKAEGAGWVAICFGWGLGVAIAVYAVFAISGAHINPAVTMGLASIGLHPWAQVPGYIIAQLLGAFVGAILVWLVYLPHWRQTEDPELKLATFCTVPAIRNFASNFVTEVIATAMLVFGVVAIVANAQRIAEAGQVDLSAVYLIGLLPLLVGLLVVVIGLSLGGPTGYAINPARDLPPRIAHAILPIAGKGGSDWSYSWIPVVAPIIGGVLGALAYGLLGFGGI
jgi:glycerol uptake facilitator